MFWWVVQALAIIILTVVIVKLLTYKIIPWFVKKFSPEKYEDFKKKYLDGEEK